MKKREITKSSYRLLEYELSTLEKEGKLSEGQKTEMLSTYEVTSKLNFIRVLLTVGVFLLGIGVLSFVASNWSHMGTALKFFSIILAILGVNLVGLKLEEEQPKTARAMHYLGVLFFGAGIFLVGQMFHLGGNYEQAFLIWSIGIMPIGYMLKDKGILIFSALLLSVYSNAFIMTEMFALPYMYLLLVPILYWMNHKLGYSKALTFVVNGLAIQFLIITLLNIIQYDADAFLYVLLTLFVAGIIICYAPVKEELKGVFRIQGNLLHGTTGLMLTFSMFWSGWSHSTELSIAFAVLYFLFVLLLIQRGHLFSIILLCILILRFYIDLSLDFMPKSLVFIIGGTILIGFGYLFEKKRKGGGLKID